MFSIGHLSDLHATPVRFEGVQQLLNKRFFGWVSWHLRRRHVYRPDVLDALIEDLRDDGPRPGGGDGRSDERRPRERVRRRARVARTHRQPRARLRHSRQPRRLRVGSARPVLGPVVRVPGLRPAPRRRRGREWRRGVPDAPAARSGGARGRVLGAPDAGSSGPLDPWGPTSSSGSRRCWWSSRDVDVCRVVLIHHPITDGATSSRRSLSDAAAVRAVLRRAGADLVLHGHNHRTQLFQVPGPEGPIPVVGVRSSSYMGRKPGKRAHYHIYDLEPGAGEPPGRALPRDHAHSRLRPGERSLPPRGRAHALARFTGRAVPRVAASRAA